MRLEDIAYPSPLPSPKRAKRKISKLTVALLAISLVIGVVAASTYVYVLVMSEPQDVDVVDGTINVPVELTLNVTSLSTLDTLELTARVYDSNAVGKTVNFYQNNNQFANAIIEDVNGLYIAKATKSGLSVGTHSFMAGP